LDAGETHATHTKLDPASESYETSKLNLILIIALNAKTCLTVLRWMPCFGTPLVRTSERNALRLCNLSHGTH